MTTPAELHFTEAERRLILRPDRFEYGGWKAALYCRKILDLMVRNPHFLDSFLPGTVPCGELTDRQKQVCIAIFQWFGDPSGQGFLGSVFTSPKPSFRRTWTGVGFMGWIDLNTLLIDTPKAERDFFNIPLRIYVEGNDPVTAEAFVRWLDSEEARTLLDEIRALILEGREFFYPWHPSPLPTVATVPA